MKKIFVLLLIIFGVFIVIFIGIFFALRAYFGDATDRAEAVKISKYPTANLWRVKDSSGFPDGTPTADIYFYTNDDPQKVFSYYQDNLPQIGWSLSSQSKTVTVGGEKNDPWVGYRKNNFFLQLSSRYYHKVGYEDWNYYFTIHRGKP